MGQVLSNLIRISFGRNEKAVKKDEEKKPIHPTSGYGKTIVAEKDEEAVVIVITDAEVREDVDSFPPTFGDRDETRVSKDERVAIIVDSGVEAVEKVKPILHGSTGKVLQEERRIKYYYSSHKILVVGDRDFSFSACLAKVFGSADNMVVTSLDSKGFLKKNYSNAMSNFKDLKSRGSIVLHGVDVTKMSVNEFLKDMRFYRIVFNFPYAGWFKKKIMRESYQSTPKAG